jgi:branched-chain amino acid transport system substrate-binding protein
MEASIVYGQEIKLGVSVSVSGKFQLLGQQALDGIRLWQSYANGRGGILLGGRQRAIRLVWYDDGSRADRVLKNVLRLIRNDQVDVLLGPYSSALTIAAAEAAEDSGKVLWNYGGTSDAIFSRGWKHVIGIASPASDYLRALPRWLAREHSELRRISILYQGKGSFAWQVARGILESARDTGHSVDLVPFHTPFNESHRRFPKLFEFDPQVVVLAASFEDELLVLRTRPRWPGTVRAVAAVAAGTTLFGTRLGAMADQVLGPSQWEPGVSSPNILGPTSEWLVDQFQKQFGAGPDYVAAGSFATGVILTECIRRADSLDNQKLRRIASTLDCHTLYGRFRIDAANGRQMGHQVLLIRWQNGQKILLHSG